MLNDLVLAKERLNDLVNGRIKTQLTEKSASFIVRICDECFEGVVHSINELQIRFMVYVAKRLVKIELKPDLGDGLYMTEKDISSSSVVLLLQTIRAVVHDIREQICTDVIFKRDHPSVSPTSSVCVADLVVFMFCIEFIKLYELIVFGDLFSARIFKISDSKVLLDDLDLIESEFFQFCQSLNVNFRLFLTPVRNIVQSLFTIDTESLVKSHDKLSSSKQSTSLLKTGTTSKKVPTQPTLNLCLDDVVYHLKEAEEYEIITCSSSQSNYHPVSYLKHDYESFIQLLLNQQVEKEEVWTSTNLTHVIARRAGYSNPKFFPLDSSSMGNLLLITLFKLIINISR